MPRFIQQQCHTCQYTEEIEKPLTFFKDIDDQEPSCPTCLEGTMREIPSLFQVLKPFQPSRVPMPKITPEGILPQEVRQAFAEELFDPCSCGQHAPAGIDEHSEQCLNKLHSFVKNQHPQK